MNVVLKFVMKGGAFFALIVPKQDGAKVIQDWAAGAYKDSFTIAGETPVGPWAVLAADVQIIHLEAVSPGVNQPPGRMFGRQSGYN